MNYKEKYEQALKRAKELLEGMDKGDYFASNGDIENIFPELQEKESEDERMKKAIMHVLYENYSDAAVIEGVGIAEIAAWLEKQGEKKPTDKVEPKFHEGDWVVYNNDICQIVKREEGCNKLVTVFGIEKELVNERNLSTARLWTIQDAKDGDVLYLQHEGGEHVIIYKRLVKKNFHTILSVHCAYDGSTNDFFEDVDSYHCITSERDEKEIHPATKEQRDLLFHKMKEAGFEWNAEKKELKKIEPKTLYADKVIEWLNVNVADFWANPCNPNRVINQFKKNFGL